MRALYGLIALILLSPHVQAETRTIELVAGSITTHVVRGGMEEKLDRKMTNDGTIVFNPIVGLAITHTDDFYYSTIKFIVGQNCISEPIVGAVYSIGYERKNFRLGLLLGGGYIQEVSPWDDREMEVGDIKIGSNYGLMPLAGVEANFKVSIGDDKYLSFNNIVTPVLINQSISVGFKF